MASKQKLFLLGNVLFIIMSISGIYALADEINKTESGLSTSAVDISLKEYNQNDELFLENGKKVMPGDEIILIPRINNLGIECYLRAKITYAVDDDIYNASDYITGNYTSWTKIDEYYYYDSVLEVEDSVDLFNKVVIPNLSLGFQERTVIIHIVVEAIQAKNFDGNWNNVEIEESIERTYDIDYSGSSSVVYEDDTNHYITLNEHFFGNLGNLLPGDTIQEEVTIENKKEDEVEFFFSVEYGELTDIERSLLRNIQIIIKNSQGEEILVSNLENKDRHSLGTYSFNEKDTVTIELSLPVNMNNDYSKLFTKVIWRFSNDIINHRIVPINPKTWDIKYDLSITVFILSAIGFVIVLFLGKKETVIIEKNKLEKR